MAAVREGGSSYVRNAHDPGPFSRYRNSKNFGEAPLGAMRLYGHTAAVMNESDITDNDDRRDDHDHGCA